jgi:hypothetical protein
MEELNINDISIHVNVLHIKGLQKTGVLIHPKSGKRSVKSMITSAAIADQK